MPAEISSALHMALLFVCVCVYVVICSMETNKDHLNENKLMLFIQSLLYITRKAATITCI